MKERKGLIEENRARGRGAFDITSCYGWNARRRKEGEDEKVRVDL